MKVRTKSRKVNRAWLADHVNDPYVKLAQKEGYRSRAAYKLKEIDEALALVKSGMRVVDLGCAPGAWSQYLRRRMGQGSGLIVGVDVLTCEPVDGVTVLQGDFREPEVLTRLVALLGGQRVDLVLSDMAPNLSGIESADAARMEHLVELAVDFACAHLTSDGTLVAKAFHGSGYSQLVRLFKQRFHVVRPIKPQASRARSAETFLVGRGLKLI